MITDGVTRAVSLEACINDDGFGYASEGECAAAAAAAAACCWWW
jgi:hypothetical protein